nr:tetratricopeptide repeat protein [uncultured Cardiobacterium sp.]
MTNSKKPGDLLNEGVALAEQGKLDEAIAIFQSIKHEDSPEQYAKAQFCLGWTLGQKGDIEGEIKAYRNIKRKYSPEMYARAQLNLGFRLGQKGDIEGAIEAYRNIKREDSSEMYAQAKFNLGFAFGQKGDIEGSIEVYRNIKREDSPEAYAKAQLNLGFKFGQKGDTEGAIEAYRNIKRENHPEAYARAQLNLGSVLEQIDNINEAIECYQNIKYEDYPDIYAKAQFNLGLLLEQKGNFGKAIEHYHNSSSHLYYYANTHIRILKIANEKLHDALYTIGNITLSLINSLIILPTTGNREYKFAHYTQASVAWKVIKNSSAFRLGLIKNVNDPMEGLTLHKFLQQSCLLSKDFFNFSKGTNYSEYVFISCFTFNHDSLNQFRLYGKENNQEASGVSLVFPSDFFDSNPDNHINAIIGLKNNKDPDLFKEKNTEIDSNYKQFLNKQPLYRCIYLDPDTGYVSLAKRDKVTFYRELLAEGKNIKELSEEAEINWNNYIDKHIIEIEKSAKESLEQLSAEIENLYTDIKYLLDKRELPDSEKTHILETLHFILLPLQYLVKHAAFQEEQECRMIHITSLDNEKIQLDWESKQVYIEYEPEVKAHLDKIYLSPGALIYEDFFRHELDDPNNPKKRVRISSNPFRNK